MRQSASKRMIRPASAARMPGTRALRHTASPARHTFGTEDDTHAGGRVGRDLLGRVVRWVVVDHEDDLEAVLPSVAADVAQDDEHGLEVTLSVDGNGDARIGWERRIAAHARARRRAARVGRPRSAASGGPPRRRRGRWDGGLSVCRLRGRPLGLPAVDAAAADDVPHRAKQAALTKQKAGSMKALRRPSGLSRSSRPAVPSP